MQLLRLPTLRHLRIFLSDIDAELLNPLIGVLAVNMRTKTMSAGDKALKFENGKPASLRRQTTRSPTSTREDWNRRYDAKQFIWSVDPNKTLTAEVRDLAPGKALDLGAGEGRNAVWLAEQGWTVHAVDFSEVAIEKGKQLVDVRKPSGRVTFEVADLRQYVPEPEKYDLVIMMFFHIAVGDMPSILLRAAQAVASGGTLVLIAHDSENLEHGFGGPQRADMLYTADFVTSIISDELAIEKAMRVQRSVKRDGTGDKIAIDCLVRAKRF